MRDLQNCKYVVAINPASVATTTATAVTIDTAGYDEFAIIVHFGSMTFTTDLTALKLQESDTDFSGADVTGGGLTLTGSGAGDNSIWGVITGKCGGARKRYLQLVCTTAATDVLSACCVLARGSQSPNTTAERGLGVAMVVV